MERKLSSFEVGLDMDGVQTLGLKHNEVFRQQLLEQWDTSDCDPGPLPRDVPLRGDDEWIALRRMIWPRCVYHSTNEHPVSGCWLFTVYDSVHLRLYFILTVHVFTFLKSLCWNIFPYKWIWLLPIYSYIITAPWRYTMMWSNSKKGREVCPALLYSTVHLPKGWGETSM